MERKVDQRVNRWSGEGKNQKGSWKDVIPSLRSIKQLKMLLL